MSVAHERADGGNRTRVHGFAGTPLMGQKAWSDGCRWLLRLGWGWPGATRTVRYTRGEIGVRVQDHTCQASGCTSWWRNVAAGRCCTRHGTTVRLGDVRHDSAVHSQSGCRTARALTEDQALELAVGEVRAVRHRRSPSQAPNTSPRTAYPGKGSGALNPGHGASSVSISLPVEASISPATPVSEPRRAPGG